MIYTRIYLPCVEDAFPQYVLRRLYILPVCIHNKPTDQWLEGTSLCQTLPFITQIIQSLTFRSTLDRRHRMGLIFHNSTNSLQLCGTDHGTLWI